MDQPTQRRIRRARNILRYRANELDLKMTLFSEDVEQFGPILGATQDQINELIGILDEAHFAMEHFAQPNEALAGRAQRRIASWK